VVDITVLNRRTLQTKKAPEAIGPYSQANLACGFIFTSGQIPLDPETGAITGTTIEEQTERVLENLKAVLEAGDSGLDKVVKTTVFLADIGDFARMNEVYAHYFSGEMLPSRSAVQVSALPKGARIEIEAIALP
jgi:2-iminobutanoate/2-iminopropanoate deaminase